MQSNEHRPPYVDFERRAVEDRSASIAQGVYVSKDVDYITIVPHGSEGKTKIEQVYDEWLAKTRTQTGPRGGSDGVYMQNSRFDPEWLQKIENMYEAWRKGEYMEVEGVPIKAWPVASPAQVKACLGLHILSVEQLAHATDEMAAALGMGGIGLRQRARDYLAAQTDPSNKVSAALEAAKIEAERKDERIKALEDQLATLASQMKALTVPKKAA